MKQYQDKVADPIVRLIELFNIIVEKSKHLFQNRWFRFSIQALIVLVSLIYIAINFNSTKELLSNVKVNFGSLGVSGLFTLAAVFCGAFGWGFTLLALGQHIPWIDNIYTHLASNLAKYIPGYAWQLVGKALLTKNLGVPSATVGFAMIIELFLLIISGLALAIITFPQELIDIWISSSPVHININYMRGILLTALMILTLIIILLLKNTRWFSIIQTLNYKFFLGAVGMSLTSWILFGVSYWLIGYSLMAVPVSYLPTFIFILTSTVILGLAIVIIPGSIGVREGLMVYLLTLMSVPSSLAVLIAAISRLIVILSELSSYLIFQFAVHKRRTFKIDSDKLQNNPKEVLRSPQSNGKL